MPLAALTGPDPAHFVHIQRQAAGAVCLTRAAKAVIHIAEHIGQRELRVALQKCRHLSLVLFRGKGAGGVDHLAAGSQAGRRVVQDLCPQCGALLHQRFTVLGHSHGFLAEHPLAGAGCIHENTVKKFRQSGGNAASVLVQHHGVGHAHPLQIAPEHLGAGGNELVAHQQPLPAQRCRQLAALAAGGRAGIQHPHPGPDPQQGRGTGSGRLLRVEHARMVVGVPPGLEGGVLHHKARLAEGRGLHRKICLRSKLLRRGTQGRDRHAPGSSLLRGGIESIEPVAQQSALPALKIFRRHESLSSHE